jgi:hypothetical protein
MPYCSNCKCEFREEITVCSDCGAQLDNELPIPEIGRKKKVRPYKVIWGLVLGLLVIAVIGLILFDSLYAMRRVGPRSYDADYIVKYENILNIMFDNEWTVKSVEVKFDEGEEACGCGIPGINPHTFIEWTVEYRDGNGDIRHFVFDNRSGLSSQAQDHVTRYIADYYKERFFNVYLEDVPLAPSTNLFVRGTSRVGTNTHLEENREWVSKTDDYVYRLSTPEGTMRLAELTPANVFEIRPTYFSIHISFSGSSGLGQNYEENVISQVEAMIASMIAYTDNRFNASISLGYHEIVTLYDGNRHRQWHIIQGEQVHNINSMYFGRYVFDSYKGVFW